jgi:hypothetical protein
VFTIKSDHGFSEAGYDKIIEWARSILPEGNRLKKNFYVAKSMMKPLSLGYQKIDMCPNFCMLFNCYWYDTTGRGIRVDPHYGLVEINSKARLRNVNNVFVFA